MNWQTHLRHVNNSPGPDAPIDVPRTQPAENQICRSDRRWPANNNMPNRTTSAKDPKIIRATSHMCGSCLITLSSPGVCSIQDRFVNFFGRVASLQAARYFVDQGELAETTDGSSATDPRTSRALYPTQVRLRTQVDAGQRGELGPRRPPLWGNLRLRLPQRGLLYRITMESRDGVSRESTADWQPSYFW